MSSEVQRKRGRTFLKFGILAAINLAASMVIQPGLQELFGDEPRGFSTAHSRLHQLRVAVVQYKTLNRTLPTTEQGLAVLMTPPVQARDQTPLMAPSELLDPWSRPYQYQINETPTGRSFEIWSLGADGLDNTADDVTLD